LRWNAKRNEETNTMVFFLAFFSMQRLVFVEFNAHIKGALAALTSKNYSSNSPPSQREIIQKSGLFVQK
jgi:hypothetical protein